jgi:hypothetical protein
MYKAPSTSKATDIGNPVAWFLTFLALLFVPIITTYIFFECVRTALFFISLERP